MVELPEVRVALCVRNEERFIESALDSLLKQTYPNFSIYIYDSCSTDRTTEICKAAAREFPQRIKGYHRHEEIIGGCDNFNFALHDAGKEPYFMWASGHDMWQPEMVARCVEALEAHPDRVLAFPKSDIIDLQGQFMRFETEYAIHTEPFERLTYEIDSPSYCAHVMGIFRLDALKKTNGIRRIPGPDRALTAEALLQGAFVHVPERLFSLRLTGGDWKNGSYYQMARREARNHITSNPVMIELVALLHPFWRFASYAKIIWGASLFSTAEKMRLTGFLCKAFCRKIFLNWRRDDTISA